MRLDTNALYFITKEELRVLTAVELGMRNHELVPVHIIERISHLKRANTYKVIQCLLKNKLVTRESKKYEGYRLTYLGYDYLALSVFMKRGHIVKILGKIGVGKESDIYKGINVDGQLVALKFARLGRVSFRAIKNKRDYIQHRKNYNWLYLSRLASIKEFSFMEILHKHGYPTPTPIDSNRHGIVMSLIDGYTLSGIKELANAQPIYDELFKLLLRFSEDGLVHSDFNEFNLMISHDLKIYVIDFPQMVSTGHPHAEEFYERDVAGLELWFTKKYGCVASQAPKLSEIKQTRRLDIEVKASGFLNKALDKDLKQLEALDNYNRTVREAGLNGQNEEYNSEDDEELMQMGSDFEGEEGEFEGEGEDVEKEGIEEVKEGNENEEKKEEDEEEDSEDEEEEEEESGDEESNREARKAKKLLPPKKKEEKEKKKKGKDDEDDEDFIDNALKKKFRQKKIIKKNVNKGKQKAATASDYFF